MMFAGKFGKDYSDSAAYRWNPRPYGHPGFTFDYLPDHPEFFNVEVASLHRLGRGENQRRRH